MPTLEVIVSRTWGKEDDLKALKSELAALDRKITADLTPKHEDTSDGEEIKPTAPQQHQSVNITPPQSSKEQEDKSSLVAEPLPRYNQTQYRFRV